MGYLAVWKVLEQMIIDFRRKGVSIPADIVNRLRSARTLINVLKADPKQKGTSQKVEQYLLDIESYLISKGEEQSGREYVEEWLRRLREAGEQLFDEGERSKRFIPGVPRDQRWIRVTPSNELPVEELKMLIEELELSYNVQPDGCLLVYGEGDNLKQFIAEMTKKYGSQTSK